MSASRRKERLGSDNKSGVRVERSNESLLSLQRLHSRRLPGVGSNPAFAHLLELEVEGRGRPSSSIPQLPSLR